MTYLRLIILFFILYIPVHSNDLYWPIDNIRELSSGFYEYRSGHIHKGIDIPTSKNTGIPVKAADDGIVFKIGYSWKGYGKVMYVKHENFISVYAHLESFENQKLMLEDLLKQEQIRKNKKYLTFNLKNPIKVKKGQVISFSGETGYGFPHLHFELRNIKNTKAINPIPYFDIGDNIKPVINSIKIKPANERSFINNSSAAKSFKAKKTEDGFYIIDNEINFIPQSEIKLYINTYDVFSKNSSNKLGIYSIEVFKGIKRIYSFKNDNVPLNDFLYVNKLFEYERCNIGPTKYSYRLYNPDNNDGIIKLSSEDESIKIKITDFSGNASILLLKLNPQWHNNYNPVKEYRFKEKQKITTSVNYYKKHVTFITDFTIPPAQLPEIYTQDKIIKGNIDGNKFLFSLPYIEFPNLTLKIKDIFSRKYSYEEEIMCSQFKKETFFKNMSITNTGENFLGITYQNHNQKTETPTLRVSPDSLYIKKPFILKAYNTPEKSSFYKLNENTHKWNYRYTRKEKKHIFIKPYSTGVYSVFQDTQSPEIQLIRHKKNIFIKFKDELSGINVYSIKIFLNNTPLDHYYDVDRKQIHIEKTLVENDHLEISVKDREGNLTTKTFKF